MKHLYTLILLALCLVGCADPQPYELGRSRTQMFGDNALRYGSMIGGGGLGYYLGNELGGGDPVISGMGAAAGVGLLYAANRFTDRKQMEAYNKGVVAGAQQGREELLVEKWRREAIYGLPPDPADYGYPDGSPGATRATTVRNVYVPQRTINGVTMSSQNQQVLLR